MTSEPKFSWIHSFHKKLHQYPPTLITKSYEKASHSIFWSFFTIFGHLCIKAISPKNSGWHVQSKSPLTLCWVLENANKLIPKKRLDRRMGKRKKRWKNRKTEVYRTLKSWPRVQKPSISQHVWKRFLCD